MTLLLFASAVLAVWCFFIFRSKYTYWKRRGVTQYELSDLIFASIKKILFGEFDVSYTEYKKFANEKVIGTYNVGKPALMLKDPFLIETVLVKGFPHMMCRANRSNPKGFYTKHVSNVDADEWKNMRSKLNPAFSSAKLKGMHSQFIECADNLLKQMSSYEEGTVLNVRDVVERYAMDVIASFAYGLNINADNWMNSQFRKISVNLFTPTLTRKIITALRLKPIIRNLWLDRLVYAGERVDRSFFSEVMVETLKERKKHNVTRQDLLHLMNELVLKDEEAPKTGQEQFIFDEDAMFSNAFLFFTAGFETSTSTISFALYELALNEPMQNRAYEHVSRVLSKHDGLADYTAVQEMDYLDQIVSETLRKYPIVLTLTRMVNKEYHLPETDLVLPVGTQINIPAFALHRDPQHYPDPEAFRPERFDDSLENPPRLGTYLPFGGGPRVCIGARMAKIEAKVALAMLISRYKFVKCSRTPVPLTFSSNNDLLWPVEGVWLSVHRRTRD